MFVVSAANNILGNPTIYKNINGIEVTIDRYTTNIVITITPIVGYNSSNTNSINSATISALSALGFTVVFNSTTIVLTSNTLLTDIVLTSYNFVIKNISNVTISTELLSIEILEAAFTYAQTPCNYCNNFIPTLVSITSQNPPIANRGQIEYDFINALGQTQSLVIGNYSDTLSYCWCGAGTNLQIQSILTIRQLNNNASSPIIFQSINPNTQINIIEFKPVDNFQAEFACCVSEDSAINVTPITLTSNRNAPHNIGIANALKYDLYINIAGNYVEVPLIGLKTGTISITSGSVNVVGTGTLGLSQLTIGSKIYDSTGLIIGTIQTITDDTHFILSTIAINTYSGTFQSNLNYFINPDTTSIFNYPFPSKGIYSLNAIYNNGCTSITNNWIINVCNSVIINTGTCNNPSIQNLSAINYVKFSLQTNTGLDIIDNITQKVILKNQLVSPLSTFQVPNLIDGFYQLVLSILDSSANILSTKTQLLFYDCNIKSCEVSLRTQLLGFNTCVDCVAQLANNKLYQDLKLKNDIFQIYKDIIYSYWNDIKQQQSIDSSWDIENHLQDITSYSNALLQIQSICKDCGLNFTNPLTISTSDCGCK